MKNLYTDTSVIGFGIRFGIVAIFGLASLYYISKNWDWYTNTLPEEYKLPVWSNSYVNRVLWIIWFALLAVIWSRHTHTHEDPVRVDLFYSINVFLVFLVFCLFFSLKDIDSARWFGILLSVVVMYIVYEAFMSDMIVAWTQVILLGITLYNVAQLWYVGKNKLSSDDVPGNCYACPT